MKNQFVRNSIKSAIEDCRITSRRNFLLVAIEIYIALMLVGCGEIGIFFSETQSFTGKDSMLLQVSRPDILDIIAEVGKSMGYSVSALDKSANTISLSSGSSGVSLLLIGKLNSATITISSKNNGKRLDIHVYTIGNFGTSGQEVTMKLVDDFKAKLIERIGQ